MKSLYSGYFPFGSGLYSWPLLNDFIPKVQSSHYELKPPSLAETSVSSILHKQQNMIHFTYTLVSLKFKKVSLYFNFH